MFADSGDIASNADVAACAFESAEAAGDLQAGLDHPKGALGFIIGERQVPLPQEGENAVLVAFEPIQQVLFFGLFWALACELCRRKRVGLSARLEDVPVSALPRFELLLRQGRVTGLSILDELEHLQE